MMRAPRRFFADNLVLEFKEKEEPMSSRRTICVYSTDDANKFKVVNSLSAMNQMRDTRYVPYEGLKHVWIDAIVNGYHIVRNEMFEGGIKEVLEKCAEEHAKREQDKGHNGCHPSHMNSLDSVHLTA